MNPLGGRGFYTPTLFFLRFAMTDKMTPFEFLRKELSHHEYNQVYLESRLEKDLGVDSLEFLELVMAVENYYDIDFEDDELEEVVTVNDFCLLAEGKLTCLS